MKRDPVKLAVFAVVVLGVVMFVGLTFWAVHNWIPTDSDIAAWARTNPLTAIFLAFLVGYAVGSTK